MGSDLFACCHTCCCFIFNGFLEVCLLVVPGMLRKCLDDVVSKERDPGPNPGRSSRKGSTLEETGGAQWHFVIQKVSQIETEQDTVGSPFLQCF